MIALIPAFIASIIFFGFRPILVMAVSIGTCIGTEWLIIRFIMKKRPMIQDFSAMVTGTLLAFSLPPAIPIWLVILGGIFAIGVGKWSFGGLGNNIVNPALAGRAFLMVSFPSALFTFAATNFGSISGLVNPPDAIAAATPLSAFKIATHAGIFEALDFQDALSNLILGNIGGCIGETSVIALIIGAVFLMYKHIIGFTVPVSFIGTVGALFWVFNGVTGDLLSTDALIIATYQIFSGALMLGALYMANDTTTSPMTTTGRLIFGVGCGLITVAIRKFGGYPEGVCFAILLMNLVVPLIDRYISPSTFARIGKR
jgi:electron transport complex protein RnfD